MNDDFYVWFSPATDVTGKALQKELDVSGGTKKPKDAKTVLCWGTKTKNDINFDAGVKFFNHPNSIRKNRNKLTALEILKKAGCNVADFSEDLVKAGKNELKFPLVARTKFHQGGAGFWLCLTQNHLDRATVEGADYIQKFIDIKDEYRLHVVNGEVVYAVKKTIRDNFKDAFISHYSKLVTNFATKNEIDVNNDTLNLVLERLARKMATGADMIVRSNSRGWKFSNIKLNNLKDNLKTEAIKAVKALDLDFGAVDCCIDSEGNVKIIECNTGPGLEASTFKAVVAALLKMTEKKEKVVPKPVAQAHKVVNENNDKPNGIRDRLKSNTNFMMGMIDNADDEQLEVMSSLWKKMGVVK